MKMFKKRICRSCNVEYRPSATKQKYCKYCYNIESPCACCGKKLIKRRTFYDFIMKNNPNYKWICSNNCRKEYRLKQETELRQCEECGKEFSCWVFSKTKLCSAVCREKAQTPKKIKIICKRCGKFFYDWVSRHRKYCSIRCGKLGKLPWNTGKKMTKKHCDKLRFAHLGKSNPHKGVPWTEKSKKKVSKTLKEKNASGEITVSSEEKKRRRNQIIKLMSEGKMPQTDTLPERLFENELLFKEILYIKQYKYKLGIADFWLPETNAIVEIDGTYWHSLPKTMERDERQNEYLESHNFIVYRFTDKEILNDVKKCVDKVLK